MIPGRSGRTQILDGEGHVELSVLYFKPSSEKSFTIFFRILLNSAPTVMTDLQLIATHKVE